MNCWKTKPTRLRSWRKALPLSRLVGLPSIRISPPLKDSSWLIKRISVDFPRTGRAEDRHHFAGLDLQVDGVKYLMIAVALGHITERNAGALQT
ncbi:hypothetical protein [Klebsiella pneumoniae]|nr:hypothetical protein [Klebsiella pneumoniae]